MPPDLMTQIRRRQLQLAVGVTATVVAWGFLVWKAIDFGNEAADGQGAAWLFLFIATLGATACLFTTLILIGKLLETLRGDYTPPRPPSSGGGKRAAR